MISIIAAVARDGAIGFHNKLIYWLPDDLRRFKSLTTGHTIVMGRRTFESLPKGALPNRRNIVLSRSNRVFEGAEVFPTLDDALRATAADDEVFIIGGASLYAQALPVADRLCLTEIDDTPSQADAFFPTFSADEWEVAFSERHEADERHAHPFRFVDYVRKPVPSPSPESEDTPNQDSGR
ncbi:MAG: dihydrofolate reductase [Bacteroidaceae bacterium]|nr:dihydrofolate reductase [Bacteroidaceae bacterium]